MLVLRTSGESFEKVLFPRPIVWLRCLLMYNGVVFALCVDVLLQQITIF